ncbi:MAG: malonyl-ACP O-methyltransferase BioC [Gammaproteobacteria bacterium]|nr:malonyl-ACP O-methyltransferase BioC [Gammaproteobacteria bacterium]
MYSLSKRALRRSFERAAHGYDHSAALQREVGDRLLDRLALIKTFSPQIIADLGCGTGYCLNRLHKLYPEASQVGVDIALSMLEVAASVPGDTCHRSLLCADTEVLPLQDGSVDLLVSNLTLQWCNPVEMFSECYRVLRPGGLLLFTTFGPDTLKELKQAWATIDPNPHVHEFIDMHHIGDFLVQGQFSDPVVDAEILTLTYESVPAMLRDLKGIGATNAIHQRQRGLMGKNRYREFSLAYEKLALGDRIPATYEVIYGHAWRLAGQDTAKDQAGVSVVPVSAVGRYRP